MRWWGTPPGADRWSMHRKLRRSIGRLGCLLVGGLLVVPGGATASGEFDFVLFPALVWQDDSDVAYGAGDGSETYPSLDVFTTASMGDFRFLGEWYLTDDSQDVQRLQFGWHFDTDDTVWLGRYHTPIGYWNTAYHHGTYLQTSISRPGIVEFEGGEGPLPTHFTGLFWEGSMPLADGAMHYSAGAGAGPVIADKLAPLDVVDPDHDHGSGMIVNVDWRPVHHGQNLVGLFAARTNIDDRLGVFRRFEQRLAGVHGNWYFGGWRLTGAWFDVSTAFEGGAALPDETFSAGYLQGEWQPAADWTVYARVEAGSGVEEGGAYLGRFGRFIHERELIGVRYEVGEHQAVTVELSDMESMSVHTRRIAVQWSAFFP